MINIEELREQIKEIMWRNRFANIDDITKQIMSLLDRYKEIVGEDD